MLCQCLASAFERQVFVFWPSFRCPYCEHSSNLALYSGPFTIQAEPACPNASVTLLDVQTGVNYQTRSDANGNYEFVNEHPGTYRVRVEAPGFETATAANFDLQVNARQRVDINLSVGQSTQNVTVTDAASVLETDSSARGQVINPKQIIDLPLNGRSYADLTLLVPGVARSPLENQSDSSRDASFNINGLRSEYNNFLLDGIDNNAYGTSNQGFSNQVIQPNPDALGEFKVETDNYSAEFGRSPGAVINATLKSGTNQFRGELWEFLRNTDLNSVGFFRPVQGGKLPFNQNQFGGALGGPIIKDKMFFFADYEGFRRVYHQVLFATLPVAAELSGDFSAYKVSLRNPLTGQAIPGNRIPASQLRPSLQLSSLRYRRRIFPEIPIITQLPPPIPPTATKEIFATTIQSIRKSPCSPVIVKATPIYSIRPQFLESPEATQTATSIS